jgi:hypothetical protein
MGGRGIEEGARERNFIRNFWEIKNSHLECEGKESRKKYVLCL